MVGSRWQAPTSRGHGWQRAPDHILVYGSLLSRCRGSLGAAERRHLRLNARLVGWGTIPGRLHDLGSYPAALFAIRETSNSHSGGRLGERVHGEVWRLRSARGLLAKLDAYEDAGGQEPEYARVPVLVTLASRPGRPRTVAAWAYHYLGDVTPYPWISNGNWSRPRWRLEPAAGTPGAYDVLASGHPIAFRSTTVAYRQNALFANLPA